MERKMKALSAFPFCLLLLPQNASKVQLCGCHFHFRSLPFPPCSLGSRPPRSGAECSYPKELSSDKSQPMRFQRTLALVLLLSLSLHLVASPDDSSHSLCTVLGDLDPSPDLAIDRTRQYLSLALPRHTSLFRLSSKSPFHCHESSLPPSADTSLPAGSGPPRSSRPAPLPILVSARDCAIREGW